MTFTLGQVLTLTTGKMLCDLGDVYRVCSELLGGDVYTHELPAAFRELEPWVRAHLPPDVAAITADEVTRENWRAFMDSTRAAHGDAFEIPPVSHSPLIEQSPIQTALARGKPVIVVAPKP